MALAELARVTGQAGALAAMAAAPWWFGSVGLRAQAWLLAVSVVVAACLGLVLVLERKNPSPISPRHGSFDAARETLRLPWATLPVVTALVLGFLQLVPFERAVATVASPGAVALRDALASEGNPSDGSLVARAGLAEISPGQTLSLCPAATRLELAWLVLVAAFFGLVQKLSFNGMIYWIVPLSQGGSPFGPFVNRNNAAGYLNLCLACGLGLVLWAFQRSGFLGVRAAAAGPTVTASVAASRSYSARRLSLGLGEFFAKLNAKTAVAVVLSSFILAGVVVSLSRGGILALALATVLTAAIALASRRFSGRVVWAGIVVLAGLGVVGWVNAAEAVRARLATLLERAVFEEGRMSLWRDAVRAVPEFWRAGSGLGTYRYVYGPYQTQAARVWYQHAENQYVEWLVEGGLAGLGLWVGFLGLVAAASWRLLRWESDRIAPVAGIVGLFALTSQATHALFDFGLRIPANSILFALICGSLTGSAARTSPVIRASHSDRLPARRWFSPRLLRAGLVAALTALGVWGAAQTTVASKLEIALKNVPVIEAWTDAADSHLCQTIGSLTEVLSEVPDDAVGQATLAKLWVALFRTREFSRLQGMAPASARREALWEETSLQFLHGRAYRLARVKLEDSLERLRGGILVQETLAVALRHLLLARRSNPLMPDVHLLIAELSVLFADLGADEVHVERSRRLAAGNPELLFRCGLLDYQARRRDDALASWQQSLTLSEHRLADVVRLLGPELASAETVQKVFPPHPELLIRLATAQFQAPERARERASVLAYAAQTIRRLDIPDAQRHYLSGAVLALEGRAAEAIVEYARAVEHNPGELAWRFELASLLESQGRWDEARREARLCVAVDPGRAEYRDLLHRISMAEAGRPPTQPKDKTTRRH